MKEFSGNHGNQEMHFSVKAPGSSFKAEPTKYCLCLSFNSIPTPLILFFAADINDCVGITCSGVGACTDEVNGYLCVCDDGYSGSDCESKSPHNM